MNQQFKPLCRMCLAFGGLLLISSVNAQTFTYKQTDLYLGFRTSSTLSNQAVVNIGSATNAPVAGLQTCDARTIIDPNWTVPGQYCIQQSNPYPASILGVIPEITVGDSK